MKLRVSHKVYAGFVVISVLILILSIFSTLNLSAIDDYATKVKEIAAPVQVKSNQLEISLLKQAKLSTLGFNADNKTEIEESQLAFEAQTKTYKETYQKLYGLLEQEPSLRKHLEGAATNYQNYNTAVSSMFSSLISNIESQAQLQQMQSTLENHVDEAGALLLELSYLEAPGKQDVVERISGAANQLDNYLLSTITSGREMLSSTDASAVNGGIEQVEFAVSNLDTQIAYLSQLASTIETDGLLDQFMSEYTKIKRLLAGDNNISQMKLQQLSHASKAANSLKLSEREVNLAISHLDNLLNDANQQLNMLQQDVIDNVDTGITRTYIIVAVLLILAIAIAYTTVRAMLVPLNDVNTALHAIAEGDLSKQLTIRSEDEFGELSSNINRVASDLRSLIENITNNSGELIRSADLSGTEMAQLSSAAEVQKQEISHVTQTTAEMSSNANYVNEQADSAVSFMNEALQQASSADHIAQDNSQRIIVLESNLEKTEQAMQRLKTESDNIGGILETIRGIAEQTNLLALNAAIEAARAGEQGRGFAVVADEVRSLAARTQESTSEIQSMIENLQNETNTASRDIIQSRSEASECVSHISTLTDSLTQINSAINQMHSVSTEIAASARQQSELSQGINSRVNEVVVIAEDNVGKAEKTLEYSHQVSNLSTRLNNAIKQFTL